MFGSPIAHSLSPIIFNAAFEKLSINRIYVPFETTSNGLNGAVQAAKTLGFAGFNVTIPHKRRVLEFLDRLDAGAKEKGSVNTVVNNGSELVGYDTDGEGAIRALKTRGFDPDNKQILVIGAGGSARSIVHSIGQVAQSIKILNRSPDAAKDLVDSIKGRIRISYDALAKTTVEDSVPGTDLLVNATPLQTVAILDQLDVRLSLLNEIGWVFDLAYDKPAERVPVARGRISALEMLLQQASLSYEIWLDAPAPLELMRSAMVSHLGGDWQ